MIIWLFDSLTISLFDSLTIWLFDYLFIWFFDYLIFWLFDYLITWLFDYLILSLLIIWLSDNLISWLFVLFYYLIIWLFDYLAIFDWTVGIKNLISKPKRNALLIFKISANLTSNVFQLEVVICNSQCEMNNQQLCKPFTIKLRYALRIFN